MIAASVATFCTADIVVVGGLFVTDAFASAARSPFASSLFCAHGLPPPPSEHPIKISASPSVAHRRIEPPARVHPGGYSETRLTCNAENVEDERPRPCSAATE